MKLNLNKFCIFLVAGMVFPLQSFAEINFFECAKDPVKCRAKQVDALGKIDSTRTSVDSHTVATASAASDDRGLSQVVANSGQQAGADSRIIYQRSAAEKKSILDEAKKDLPKSPLASCPWFGVKSKCQGELTLSRGEKYIGEIEMDRPHGRGMVEFEKGQSSYVGDFRGGVYHGFGTLKTAGVIYFGQFTNGQFNGWGEITLLNGNRYVGEFENNNYDGVGTMYASDGSVKQTGIWKKDVFKGSGSLVATAVTPPAQTISVDSAAQFEKEQDSKWEQVWLAEQASAERLRTTQTKNQRPVFKIKCDPPTFPAGLLDIKGSVSGETLVRVTISKEGIVSAADIVASSGFELWDLSVISAAKKCIYQSALANGIPVEVKVNEAFSFSIEGSRQSQGSAMQAENISGPKATGELQAREREALLARERKKQEQSLIDQGAEEVLARVARDAEEANRRKIEQERLTKEALSSEQERQAQLAKAKEQERQALDARKLEEERLAQAAIEQERQAQLARAKAQERQEQAERKQEKDRLAQIALEKERAQLEARQRDEELAKLRLQLSALEEAKNSKDQKTVYATRRALVIGNDSYRQVTKLTNAREDARAIADNLAQVGYQVTLKLDVTEKDMKSALRTFKSQVEGGDEVLVFFAGHGVQLGSANYLLPIDIAGESAEQIKDDAIQLQRLLDDMSERKAKFTLALIDACRDNPFKTVSRDLSGRGLAPTTAATGQMVIFSAGAGQQALDKLGPGDKNKNGVFTRIFIKEMQKSGVSIDRVVRNVRNEVVEMAKSVGHEQVPAIYDQVVGDFYFRR